MSSGIAKERIQISNIFILAVISVGSILCLIPFIYMVSVSLDLKAVNNIPFPPSLLPKEFSFNAYTYSFKNINMVRLYTNTLYMSAGCILISVFSSLLAGYSISKLKFKGRNAVLVILLATMMIPGEATLIPLFLLYKNLSLINTYWVFFLPAVVNTFGAFLSKQFMDTLPGELREAARMDGAGEYGTFFRIYLPLCGPITATMVILFFLWRWNDFLGPLLYLTDSKKYVMQLGLALFRSSRAMGGSGSEGFSTPLPAISMATTVISIVPVLGIFLFFQRYIVESIALSGIKQ
jgi:multiple sugar transport system permease protein